MLGEAARKVLRVVEAHLVGYFRDVHRAGCAVSQQQIAGGVQAEGAQQLTRRLTCKILELFVEQRAAYSEQFGKVSYFEV